MTHQMIEFFQNKSKYLKLGLKNHLRNKFHFSKVHRRMNTMDPVQSDAGRVSLSLCMGPTLMNLSKNEIHLLYLHSFFFYIVFVNYL